MRTPHAVQGSLVCAQTQTVRERVGHLPRHSANASFWGREPPPHEVIRHERVLLPGGEPRLRGVKLANGGRSPNAIAQATRLRRFAPSWALREMDRHRSGEDGRVENSLRKTGSDSCATCASP